jgi:hypothetical protein
MDFCIARNAGYIVGWYLSAGSIPASVAMMSDMLPEISMTYNQGGV